MAILSRTRLPIAASFFCLIIFYTILAFSPPRHPAPPAKDVSQYRSPALPSSSEFPIPRQIWQIFFPPPNTTTLAPSTFLSAAWISMAPGYTYSLVSTSTAPGLITTLFPTRPELSAMFQSLTNPALKSDLLRYLLLSAAGGTYSDIDTKPLVPLDSWLPTPDLRETTRLIIALEFDSATNAPSKDITYPVQFCQWTISSAPNHPLLGRMVDRSVSNLQAVAAAQGTTMAETVFSDGDVLNATGPVAWSETVMDTLKERDSSVKGWLDLAGLREPRVFGDIVVLPVESFRADWRDDWGGWLDWRGGRRTLVRHYFRGSWRVGS